MSPTASREIGQAYANLPEHDNSAVPAFKAMREETKQQFDFMTRPKRHGGMGLNVEVVRHDPYGANNLDDVVKELRTDVTQNKQVKVLATAETGGHPFFSNDDNDMFRAVHDVFGHLGAGRGVDRHGEEAAFQKHSRMYSPIARQAMATETRGQNSAFVATGEFQDQKIALLPQVMQSRQFSAPRSLDEARVATAQARNANKNQGI